MLTAAVAPDMRLTDKSPDFIDPTGGETHAMEERERRGSGDGYVVKGLLKVYLG